MLQVSKDVVESIIETEPDEICRLYEVSVMCMFCKDSTMIKSTTTQVIDYKGCTIIIKNIPCLECVKCGERYYSDEVMQKLEDIVNAAKKLIQEAEYVYDRV